MSRPALFAILAQGKGLGVAAPLYYFLHWVLTPIDTFKSTDMRLTNMIYTRAILPSLLMVYYLPLLQTHLLHETSQRQTWLQLWSLFPIAHSIAQFAISKIWKDTINQDKIHKPKRDVATIRYTIGIPTLISTIAWLYTLFTSSASVSQIFLPHHFPTSLTNLQTSTSTVDLIQYNYLIPITSTYLWLLYFAWDAKTAGMISQNWITVFAVLAMGTVVLGPGGAVGVGFLWREYVITEKRHRGALTMERVRGRDGGVGKGKEM
jgi:hypothetical protein